MDLPHATFAQRIGIFLAAVEALLLGFLAALHFGARPTVAGMTFATPFLYPAAITEGVLALVLLVSLLAPGRGVRPGRVLVAQILVVLCVFAAQVALARGWTLVSARSELVTGIILVLALASIALVASPVVRRRELAH